MALNPSGTPSPRRHMIPAALVAVAVLIAAGAAIATTAAYFELRPSGPPAPGTVAVTDDLGRTVNVPVDPSRVVVLSPNIVDSMVRLGLRERVVGVDCESAAFGGLTGDYSPAQITSWNLTSALCVQVGPTLSVEDLLNKTPQLVLTSTIVSLSDIEEISSTYGIPVVTLAPATLGGIVVDVELLRTIFPSAPGAELVGELQRSIANASALSSALAANGTAFPTVLLVYYVTPAASPSPGYWTFGPGTFGESLVEAAGGVGIAANSTVAYPELSGAQVLAADPQVLLYGTGFGLDLSTYQGAPDWGNLPAVAAGHDYPIDSTLITEAGPTMLLEGLPQLTALLHPGA